MRDYMAKYKEKIILHLLSGQNCYIWACCMKFLVFLGILGLLHRPKAKKCL